MQPNIQDLDGINNKNIHYTHLLTTIFENGMLFE